MREIRPWMTLPQYLRSSIPNCKTVKNAAPMSSIRTNMRWARHEDTRRRANRLPRKRPPPFRRATKKTPAHDPGPFITSLAQAGATTTHPRRPDLELRGRALARPNLRTPCDIYDAPLPNLAGWHLHPCVPDACRAVAVKKIVAPSIIWAHGWWRGQGKWVGTGSLTVHNWVCVRRMRSV